MRKGAQFSLAVHILSVLGHNSAKRLSSAYIAKSVNTNPAVIRRILVKLTRAGVVVSHKGADGGFSLARPTKDISLRDIFVAVEDGTLVPIHANTINEKCTVSRNVRSVLISKLTSAYTSFENELSKASLDDIIKGIESAE